jgi:type IV pilus assembly protein PilY1
MKANLKQNVLSAAISFACMTLAAAPAYASDTEVYVQSNATGVGASPALMMVLDTSGSMLECVSSTNSCSSPNRRVDAMASAMQKILFGDSASGITPAPGNIRMGYTRFASTSTAGGWVKYPARPLDAFVEINPNGYIYSSVSQGSQDAVQGLLGLANTTGNELLIGGASDQAAGFYFPDVALPKGATVTSAMLELTPKASNSGLTTLEVSVDSSSTPSEFTLTSILSRTYGATTTAASDQWTAEEKVSIPVTSLLQEVSDRSTWCGGNAVALRVRDIGGSGAVRRAYSFEGAAGDTEKVPRLVISFSIDPNKSDSCIKMTRTGRTYPVVANNDDIQWATSGSSIVRNGPLTPNIISSTGSRTTAAIRVQNVGIPKGVTITKAELIGKVIGSISVKPIAVRMYQTDNMPAMCSGSTCTRPSSSVGSGMISPASATSYSGGELLPLNVKDLVQTIVNRSGWSSGNAMGFQLMNNLSGSANSGNLQLVDANSSLANAMRLVVDWTETVTDLSKLITVREDLGSELTAAKLNVTGSTPLAAAYGEASLYMHGLTPSHSPSRPQFIDPRTVDASGKYESPVLDSNKCGANYIFLLTDGDPNEPADTRKIANTIRSRSSSSYCPGTNSGSGNSTVNWQCMYDMAGYNILENNFKGVPLRTNTVIFGPLTGSAAVNMKKLADTGQGNYYKAGDEKTLVNALNETIKSLVNAGASVASPGVAVNQMSRLTHLDQLFYAVFDPEPQKTRWEGNLKRYRLDLANEQIKDADDENAVDSSTGFFRDGSRSFWSLMEDGAKAVEGGASSKLVPANRSQYTYLGLLTAKNQALSKIDLTSSSFNSAAKPKTGMATDNEYLNLMNWYRGYVIPELDDGLVPINSSSLTRNRMGAGLHSKPVLVNYGYTAGTDGSNPANQKNYVFFSTMEGTLHAIDANSGVEKFSFIPGEKLSVLKSLYDNSTASLPEFGMDLSWTVYRSDTDYNNQIGAGDKIYIYGGMRMGGTNYYALDVTDLNSPKMLFAINGGSTTAEGGRYAKMGQTWSQPVLGNIKVGGAVKTVIVFGGGYDPRHEQSGKIHTGTDLGTGLYIVDAFDGSLIWSATGNSSDNPTKYVSTMKYSVPTAPKLVDFNGDGLVDNIYFGDLGGQLFRVDVDNGASASALAKRVRLIAKLGQTVTADISNQRRFYEPATVALFEDNYETGEINGGRTFAAIALGSGYRSHPLDTATQDRFYTILDFDATREDLLTLAEASTSLRSVISPSDLSKLDPDSENGADRSKPGWYIDLPDSGEKSMAQGLILFNQLYFTTYVPSVVGGSLCSPVIGRTKLYRQCMPFGDVGETCEWEGDRAMDNVMMGIGGEPQYIFQEKNPGSDDDDTLTGGVLVGSTVLSDGDYKPRMKRQHRFREKRN